MNLKLQDLKILSGDTISASCDTCDSEGIGLEIPAAFEGTTLTLKDSRDNVTFLPVKKDDGTDYTIAVAASTKVLISPAIVAGLSRYIKVVSNNIVAANRTIVPVGRVIR